jgi:hypothetical protein
MPTDILRKRNTKVSAKDAPSRPAAPGPRQFVLTAGRISLTATLRATPTADRIWAALPLFSSVETWGQAVHFEVPVETGREAGANATADVKTLYFWPDEHRIIAVFGKTPISRRGEKRLPVPCNAWADTSGDLSQLGGLEPGEKISLERVTSTP